MGSQDSDKWEIKLKIHRGICSDQMLGPKVSRDFVGFKNFSKQVRSFQIQFWVSIRNIQALQCHSEKKWKKSLGKQDSGSGSTKFNVWQAMGLQLRGQGQETKGICIRCIGTPLVTVPWALMGFSGGDVTEGYTWRSRLVRTGRNHMGHCWPKALFRMRDSPHRKGCVYVGRGDSGSLVEFFSWWDCQSPGL